MIVYVYREIHCLEDLGKIELHGGLAVCLSLACILLELRVHDHSGPL